MLELIFIAFMYFPFSEVERISTQMSNLFDVDSIKIESEINIEIKPDVFPKVRGSENINS